jgi:pimeloyl-ACP methyl ester carboxylesterase
MERNHRMTPQLAGYVIPQPCFFLTGEDDPVVMFGPGGVAGQEKRLRQACSDLRGFVVLQCEEEDGKQSAGHWIQQERSAEVNAHLLSFLTATSADFATAPGVAVPKQAPKGPKARL